MMRPQTHVLRAALLVLLLPAVASAVPTLSIDVDLGTPGIQWSAVVDLGGVLPVAVVLTNDDGTPVSSVALDVTFNAGVVDLAPGGDPTAGALAGTSPLVADAFGGGPAFPGSPLTPHFPAAVNSIGGVGLTSFAGAFVTPPPPGETSVVLMAFAALAPGATVLSIEQIASRDSVLAFGFEGEVPSTLESATIRVRDPQAVPEPGTWLLLSSALLLAGARRRCRR